MITLTITGSYEGTEESKSYPGMFYIYVRPIAQPPAGVLKAMKCPRNFGAPLDGMQEIGSFAVLCDKQQIPSADMGEKIGFTAHYWPVSRPIYSEYQNAIIHASESTPVYVLDGAVQPVTSKAAPVAFAIKGYNAGTTIDAKTRQIKLSVSFDDAPPRWLLRSNVRVRKGRGFIVGSEVLGKVVVSVPPDIMPSSRMEDSINLTGVCWPVSSPYYNPRQDAVKIEKVPTPCFIATGKRTAEKVENNKAKAS